MSDLGRPVRSAWRRGVAAGLLFGTAAGAAIVHYVAGARPGEVMHDFWLLAIILMCSIAFNMLRPREVRERTPWLVQKFSGFPKPRLRLLWWLGTGIVVLGFVSVIVCGVASNRWGWIGGSWPIPVGLLVMVSGLVLALPAGKVLGFDK